MAWQASAERQVASLLRADGRVRAGAVSVDAWSGRVALTDVTADVAPGVRVRAGRITVRSGRSVLGWVGQAQAASDSASVDDVDVDAGGPKVHIPHADIVGGALSSGDLAALADALAHIESLDVASVSMPEINLDGPNGGRVTLNKVDLGNIKRGRIGVLTIAGASLEGRKAAEADAATGSLGAVTIGDLDMGLIRRALTGAREQADEAMSTAVGSATVDGFRLSTDSRTEFAIGRITLRDLRARPLLERTRNGAASFGSLSRRGGPEQIDEVFAFLSDLSGSMALGQFEVRDLTASHAEHGGHVVFRLGRIGLGDLDGANLGSFGLDNLTVDAPDGNGHLASFSVRDVQLEPALRTLADLRYAELLPEAPRDREKSSALIHAGTEAYRSVVIGGIELKDAYLRFQQPREGTTTIALARYAVADFRKARLGESAIEGLDVAAQDGHVKMDQFGVRGLDYGPSLDAIEQLATTNPLDPVAVMRAAVPSLDQIVLSGVDIDVPDKKHQGNADNGARDKGSLARIQVDGSRFVGGVPTELSAVMDHVTVEMPATSTDPDAKRFIALGYPKVDVSDRFGMTWDEAAKTLRVSNGLEGVDMGSVGLDVTFGGIDKDLFNTDLALAEVTALGATLQKVELHVQNTGLVDRVIAFDAKQSNQSVEDRKRGYVENLTTGLPPDLRDNRSIAAIVAAVTKFIAKPGKLTVVATAPGGISPSDLMTSKPSKKLLDALEVTATAE